MISSGNLLSSTPVSESTEQESKEETRMFKFGELQVELTREKTYIGSAIGFVYGVISWELSQGIQNIPESTFKYANENASLITQAKLSTSDDDSWKEREAAVLALGAIAEECIYGLYPYLTEFMTDECKSAVIDDVREDWVSLVTNFI